jgi:hypothetical protein
MVIEDNSKGAISPEVSDIEACPPSEDEQTRRDSAGQRYGSKLPRKVVERPVLFLEWTKIYE